MVLLLLLHLLHLLLLLLLLLIVHQLLLLKIVLLRRWMVKLVLLLRVRRLWARCKHVLHRHPSLHAGLHGALRGKARPATSRRQEWTLRMGAGMGKGGLLSRVGRMLPRVLQMRVRRMHGRASMRAIQRLRGVQRLRRRSDRG